MTKFRQRADEDRLAEQFFGSPPAEEPENEVNRARAARGGGDSRALWARFIANRSFFADASRFCRAAPAFRLASAVRVPLGTRRLEFSPPDGQ